MNRAYLLPLALCLGLAACSAGNVSSTAGLHGPKPPPTKNRYYDPNAAYASARATWAPLVYDRQGTIVRLLDPRVMEEREDYEHAAWATGAQGGSQDAPPGTF